MKKVKKYNGIYCAAISLIAIVVISVFGVAQYGKAQLAKSEVAELTELAVALDNVEAFKLGIAYLGDKVGINLGAVPGGDFYNPVMFYDTFGVGHGKGETRYFYKTVPFASATSTLAVFNPDSEGYNDFYLMDIWLTNDEKATSTTRLAVTTSTATVIAQDDTTMLDADNGQATLMQTFGNAFGADGATYDGPTATSSKFYLRQYPGTDNRLTAGTNYYPFLMNSTTNILVFATSTQAGPVYAGGMLHILGVESDR